MRKNGGLRWTRNYDIITLTQRGVLFRCILVEKLFGRHGFLLLKRMKKPVSKFSKLVPLLTDANK
jgi:hypothetical protein